MRYEVTGEFVKISETTGTIQNMSNVYAVEVSNKSEADSGIILYPLNRISVTLSECYLRCVDGGNAEVRVVPFEVDVTRGGGSSAAGTSNLTDVFRSLEVINGKVNFYGTTDKSGDILDSFNLPEEIVLNQVGTIVVHDFMFSALAYPNSTNPNLDGKTVLVLAVKGDKKTNPTIKYVFVDLQKLVDKYLASNKSININGYSIAVNISDDTENLLALKEDGLFVGSDDSKLDKVPSAVQDNIPVFDVDGTIIDGGLSFADLEYELPTASVTTKGGVKVGSGLAITGDTLNVTISGGVDSVFTGATSVAGGLSGIVPAPVAGDEEKFLRGDGTWSTVASGGSSSTEMILPTVPATVNGGFWLDVSGETPVPKFFYGGNVYPLSGSADSDSRAGLISWLKFDTDATTDECGLTWTATGNPTVSSTNAIKGKALQLDGSSYLTSNTLELGGKDFTAHIWANLSSAQESIIDLYNTASNSAYTIWLSFNRNSSGTNFLQTGYYQANGQLTYHDNSSINILNKATHCAIVYQHDASKLKFYIDGTAVDSYDVTIPRGSYQINLSNDPNYPNGTLVGTIDEFQLYDGVALWDSDFTPPTADFYA